MDGTGPHAKDAKDAKKATGFFLPLGDLGDLGVNSSPEPPGRSLDHSKEPLINAYLRESDQSGTKPQSSEDGFESKR